ncbi:MAG: hypothetical protein D6730_00415 [Bacteroidetes bacterium]|nr:MAG: hypothetical protein D6730_00415 [Bacteroidota bacterium]
MRRKGIFEALYPKEAFDFSKLRKLSSELCKLFERFLLIEELQKGAEFESSLIDLLLLELKVSRNLLKHTSSNIEKQVNKIRVKLEQNLVSSVDPINYLHRYQLERFVLERASTTRRNMEMDIGYTLEKASEALDNYFMCAKLRLALVSRHRSIIKKSDKSHQAEFMDTIFQFGIDKGFESVPFCDLYARIYHLLGAPYSEAFPDYHDYKEVFLLHFSKLQPNIQSELILLTTNLLTKWYRETYSKVYLEEFFFWYQQLLKEGLVQSYPSQMRDFFLNYTKAGVELEKLQETEDFLEKYKTVIPEVYRDNIYAFCKAQLFFKKKAYREALIYLSKMDMNIDLKYKLRSDVMYIQLFYELDDPEQLEARLKSMKDILRRRTILRESRRNEYLHFVTFVGELMKMKENPRLELAEIRGKIADLSHTPGIYEKSWLLEKWQQLEAMAK